MIDFRRPRPREVLKHKIYELYQAALTREEIAEELKIGDTTVERYLKEIHAELGITKPSKSERRKLINARPDKLPLYLRIAPEALRLVQQGVLRGKIAELLQTNTTTLEKTMDYLRKQGHDIPDARSTNSGRKPSDQQASPPSNSGDDETQNRQAG